MRYIHFALTVAALMLAGAAHADLFKCTVGNKVIYQQHACAAGTEKALNDSQRQARLKAEADKKRWEEESKQRSANEEQAKAKETKEKQDNIELLRLCRSLNQCEVGHYQSALRGLKKPQVRQAMGREPDSAQNVGGNTYEYYSVSDKGGRTVKLQLVYGVSRIHAYDNYDVVSEVNIY